ncbi:hypothetical protein [Syntrophomonas erecta]
MFFTFLNKEDPHYLDLSVLVNHQPSEVLFYYYHSYLRISLEAYNMARRVAEDGTEMSDTAHVWLKLIAEELAADEDLTLLAENDFLNTLGPYYYPATNTRFYFTKTNPDPSEVLTANDVRILLELDSPLELNDDLKQYAKNRKARKNPRSRDDLIRDIQMGLLSLQEIEKLNRHLNYLNKLLEQRYSIVEQEEVSLIEPDMVPDKPAKTLDDFPSNIITFPLLKPLKKKQQEAQGSRHSFEMKVYFIRYREYEKACDRYKALLEDWPQLQEDFLNRCLEDIDIAETKIKADNKYLKVYNSILSKAYVHSAYHDVKSLNIFKAFLETGRASSVQECINLFEEERHWNEIKASQERIENTIYFLQNGGDQANFAGEQLERLLKLEPQKPVTVNQA